MSGTKDHVTPGVGVITVTAPDRTPDFEIHCITCKREAWWDCSEPGWYCGCGHWFANPCGEVRVETRWDTFWMPKFQGFPEPEL